MNKVFECHNCGKCCEGRGGIVLTNKDISRLATHLAISPQQLVSQYTEIIADKMCLQTGKDGFCLFFEKSRKCTIHVARPDICRAWPYFRGNLCDPYSFEMIKEYCQGMEPNATFESFRALGFKYMEQENLFLDEHTDGPNALKRPL